MGKYIRQLPEDVFDKFSPRGKIILRKMEEIQEHDERIIREAEESGEPLSGLDQLNEVLQIEDERELTILAQTFQSLFILMLHNNITAPPRAVIEGFVLGCGLGYGLGYDDAFRDLPITPEPNTNTN